MGVWVWLRWCFFYNGVPVFSLSFYVLKLVSGVHFNESANTALLKCTEANSVCVCFSVTGLDVRKYGNAELHVRATKLTQIKVIFLPSREKICFSTTRGRCLDFFFEEQMQAIYIYIYIALSINLETEDYFPLLSWCFTPYWPLFSKLLNLAVSVEIRTKTDHFLSRLRDPTHTVLYRLAVL